LNLFVAEAGTCDTLACVSESTSGENDTCVKSQVGASGSFQSQLGTDYFLEVISVSPSPYFDQNGAGTSGFVRVETSQ
jgi:hypothetical protein